MKLFGLLLLVGMALGAPTSKEDDKVVVTEELFPKELSIYKADHDIVNLFLPVNGLNFDDDSEDDDTNDDSDPVLFFVLGDKTGDKIDYKGLYIFKSKKATKLLDNGIDLASKKDDSKTVYIGATDGIYIYNGEKNVVEKYGSVTDSIINIVKPDETDAIYILTADKTLYKVTEDGNKKVKVDDVKNAQQIVMDLSDNIYYYDSDKKIYVINEGGVKEITGLPESRSEIILLRPPFVIGNGVPAIIDNKSYVVYANGTVELGDFEFRVKPTAYSMEATLIQYYAYNKSIYEYNILALIFGDLLAELRNFFNANQNQINSIATRSRSNLKANA